MSKDLNGRMVFVVLCVVFTTSFMFGYNGMQLNQPFRFVRDFFNRTLTERRGDGRSPTAMSITVMWSCLNAVYVIGLVIGCLIAANLLDKIGRRNSIFVAHTFAAGGVVVSTCCVLARSPEMLYIGRVLFGIVAGMANVAAPVMLSEIATTRIRGALCACHQLVFNVGGLLAFVFGLPQVLSTADRWPFLFLINLGPLLVVYTCLPFIPPTPRFLYLAIGEVEKARASLKWYRCTDDVELEMSEMAIEKEAQEHEKPFTVHDLLQKKYARQLCIATLLQAGRCLSGTMIIYCYSANIFRGAGVQDYAIPYTVVGVQGCAVVCNIVSMSLIDLVGRRKLLISTECAMIVSFVLLVIMMSIVKAHRWAADVSIVCVFLFMLTSQIGIGPIAWVLGAELFEQRARPLAGSAAGFANYASSFVGLIIFEPLNDLIHQYVFLIFVGVMLATLIFVIKIVPETKNKTFHEIAEHMMHRRASYIPA